MNRELDDIRARLDVIEQRIDVIQYGDRPRVARVKMPDRPAPSAKELARRAEVIARKESELIARGLGYLVESARSSRRQWHDRAKKAV
jgi:hypothetical protein